MNFQNLWGFFVGVDVDEGLELGCKSKGAIFETLAINKVEIGFY